MEQNKPFFKQIEEVKQVIVVLSGSFRQNIIEVLKQREETPYNIAMELKSASAHVSKELAILRKLGIVGCEQRSSWKYYFLHRERLERLEKAVQQFNEAI